MGNLFYTCVYVTEGEDVQLIKKCNKLHKYYYSLIWLSLETYSVRLSIGEKSDTGHAFTPGRGMWTASSATRHPHTSPQLPFEPFKKCVYA